MNEVLVLQAHSRSENRLTFVCLTCQVNEVLEEVKDSASGTKDTIQQAASDAVDKVGDAVKKATGQK